MSLFEFLRYLVYAMLNSIFKVKSIQFSALNPKWRQINCNNVMNPWSGLLY